MRIQQIVRLLALLTILAFSAACGNRTAEEDVTATEEPVIEALAEIEDAPTTVIEAQIEALGEQPEAEVSSEAIRADPLTWAGQVVHVSGIVDEVIGERYFTITSAAEAEPLLVIVVGNEGAPSFTDDSSVTVTGAVVAEFSIVDLEKTTGLDLDNDLLSGYEGVPALVATAVSG